MATPFLFDIPDDIDLAFIEGADHFLDPTAFGRQVTLIFNPTNSMTCPNCLYNTILGASSARYNSSNPNPAGPLNIPFTVGVCPVCKGRGKIESTVPLQTVINMLVIPNPIGGTDDFDIAGNTLSDVATKYYAIGFATDRENIERCNHAIMDGDRVKRIGPLTPIGLRSERYVETYWEKTN